MRLHRRRATSGIFLPRRGVSARFCYCRNAPDADCKCSVPLVNVTRSPRVHRFYTVWKRPENAASLLPQPDRPALERVMGATQATTIAEFFAISGKRAVLLYDSLDALRAGAEIAYAGETAVSGEYPPAYFSALPRL